MQPIFLIAAIAAGVALSIGYLGNDINLEGMVQEFGAGEGTMEIPTESVDIGVIISRIGSPPSNFKDFIVVCLFSSPTDTIEKDSMIFCKLLDQMASAKTVANVIAEGMKITGTISPNETVTIPITFFKFFNSHNVNNVHDMIIVIKGP